MQKLTKKEIDEIANPFTIKEAKPFIGKYIKKRPGVYANDNGSVYKILDIDNNGFQFFEGDCFHKSYKFENIIYDYVFSDDSIIGIYK
jgi:hypothetical protein